MRDHAESPADREKHLIRHVRACTSAEEVRAMRQALIAKGEAITTDLLVAISEQIQRLEKSGGRR